MKKLNIDTILIEMSPYSLLIFLLLKNQKEWEKTLFIFNEGINLTIIEKFKKNFKNVYVFKKANKKYKKIDICINYLKYIIFLRKVPKNVNIYSKLNLIISYPFKKLEKNYIEEGKANPYYFHEKNKEIKKIKKIYLTENAKIKEFLKNKIERIDLKELWNKKSQEEKKKILELYNVKKDEIENLNGKKNILLTQPIEEHGSISEEYKVNLYKKILKGFKMKDTIIKKHPRDKTDYEQYFEEATVLNSVFPIEILDFLEVEFENVITLCSTGALNIKAKNLYYWGTEFDEKLEKEFGKVKNITILGGKESVK